MILKGLKYFRIFWPILNILKDPQRFYKIPTCVKNFIDNREDLT